MSINNLVSVVAVTLTMIFAWPHVFRILRHGVDGVSVGAITLSMAAAATWLGYGLARGSNIIVLPVAAYITMAASRSHHELVGADVPSSGVSR